ISQLYLDLLRRPVDPTGLAFWSDPLNSSFVLEGIQTSVEFKALEVKDLYQHYLKRAPDPGAQGTFLPFLLHGGTFEQADAEIISSPEYFQKRGGGTNSGWLAALYEDALGRPIDPVGAAGGAAALAGGASLFQVAGFVLSSEEYRTHLVDVFFQDYLRRH